MYLLEKRVSFSIYIYTNFHVVKSLQRGIEFFLNYLIDYLSDYSSLPHNHGKVNCYRHLIIEFCSLCVCVSVENSKERSSETRKLVAVYLHGSGLNPLSNNRRALLAQGRLITSVRSAQGRAQSAMRAELKQTVNVASAPYTTTPGHRTR